MRTHDLCDAGAVLYQLSYQANFRANAMEQNIGKEKQC